MHIIAEADKVLSDALSYTRTLVAELSPPALRNHGLLAGLKWLGEYMRRYQLNVTVQVPDEEIRIADDYALLLFQSVRELLINCAKYAETSEAWVTTNIDTDQLVIEVMDKGRGFESDRPANVSSDVSSNFGLFSIKERMHALGGSFQIVSSPGSGTIAALRLPLSAARASAEASGLSDTCQELSLPLFPL
jgi:signal transduction histidine kinase